MPSLPRDDHDCFLEPEPAYRQARNRVSHRSGSAWRIVIAKTDGRSVQLWRARIVWCAWLAARRYQRRDRGDSLSSSKPFAMNLWVSMEDEGARTADENGFNRSLAPLVADFVVLGAPHPTYKPYSPKRFEDQARVLLDANVPAFSFIFGMPAREILEECHAKGIVTIGTATTLDEAVALQDAGLD